MAWFFILPDLELLECSFKVPVQSPLLSIQIQLWCGRGCNEHRELAQPGTGSAAAHPHLIICSLTLGTEAGHEHGQDFCYRHLTLMSLLEI